jgi:uncharacterized membrane protein
MAIVKRLSLLKERERRKLKRHSMVVHLIMAGCMAMLYPLALQEPRIYISTKCFILFSTTIAISYIVHSFSKHLKQIDSWKLSYIIG